MVLGMLMSNCIIVARFLEGTQNSENYVATIEEFCMPIMKLNIAPKIYLVQDNCSIHVFKRSTDFFKTQDFEIIE